MSICRTDFQGNIMWFRRGEYHRENGPAIITRNGTKYWYFQGKLHRKNFPAIEYENGDKEWYKNGKLHRTNGPAVERMNGARTWYFDDRIHRVDGPASIEENGEMYWWRCHKPWPQGEKIYVLACAKILISLELPVYVVKWIIEFMDPNVVTFNELKFINLLQDYKNSRKIENK